MGRSSYADLAQILKTFLEKIIEKLESESRQIKTSIPSSGITLNLQNQLDAISDRITDIKSRADKLDEVQRYGQKKIETRLQDGSKLLQVDSQLSDNMHNIQTMNEYEGKVYYESVISSDDGKTSYKETLVDDKEAGKEFTERKSKVIEGQVHNVVSYYEENIRIPNTGSRTMLIASADGEPPMPKEVNDENKDIRIKVETDPEKYYRKEETTPILDKNGKQIGMRTIIRNEEPMGHDKSAVYREVYDSGYGKPPRCIETRVAYDNDGVGVASAVIIENGKMIQSLRKDNKGEIRMRAFDRNSGEYIDGKYPNDNAGIVVCGGTNDNHTPRLELDISGECAAGRDYYGSTDYPYNDYHWTTREDAVFNPFENGRGDSYFDIDFDDPNYNENGTNFGVSSEFEDATTKADWGKTTEYFENKKAEYDKGVGRLEHNYIREQENERRAAHSREQKDNESR